MNLAMHDNPYLFELYLDIIQDTAVSKDVIY